MDDSNEQEIPDFATLAADPEIAPLLDFEPVPRKIEVPGGWSPDKQREVRVSIISPGSTQLRLTFGRLRPRDVEG